MKQYLKKILHLRLAELLDHLYFHDIKSQINIMIRLKSNQITIIAIFLMQKLYLLFWPSQSQTMHSDEVYLNISGSLFSWITFQKPLEMINSDQLNILISALYTFLHSTMFIVFCFSLYNWQIISKVFTFYISYFQLLILYHTEIHHLNQKFDLPITVPLGVQLYINYLIIVYCSRNYFIISQQHMLRRYSFYNYLIVLADFLYFITFSLCTDYVSKYSLLLLSFVYFIDAIIMQPYCIKINLFYIGATAILLISVVIRIALWQESLYTQFYTISLIVPLCSYVLMKIYSTICDNIFQQKLSISLILHLGEIINHHNQTSIQKGVGDYIIKKFIDVQTLNVQSILQLLEFHLRNLEKTGDLEEIQLYRILLKHEIQGTYLQSLLETKRYQIQNRKHSLFFKTIGFLISKKYDQQIQDLYSGESKSAQNHHYQIIKIKETDNLFQNYVGLFTSLLEQKIYIWNQLQQGYDKIENTVSDLTKMYEILNKLKNQILSMLEPQEMGLILKVQTLKRLNIVELRLLSLYYSFLLNDYQQTKNVEIYLEELIRMENNQITSSLLNLNILNNDLIIISSSILEQTGKMIKSNTEEISRFFGYDENYKKQNLTLINLYMPKFISQDHDKFIQKFINKGNSTLYNQGKQVFCKDYEGFIFPIMLSFLHINEKSEDFILTTSLQKIKSNQDYILFDQNGKILGISKYAYSMLINSQTHNGSTQSLQSAIDQSIYECYIQFWIPNIDTLIQHSNFDHDKGQINQLILELSILANFMQYLYYFKQYQNINPHFSKEASYFEEFLQYFKRQLSNQSYMISVFQYEVQIQMHLLPTDQFYYICSMSKQQKDVQSMLSLDKEASTYQEELMNKQYHDHAQTPIIQISPKLITELEKSTEMVLLTNRVIEKQQLIKEITIDRKDEQVLSNRNSQQIMNKHNSSQYERQKSDVIIEFDDQKISQSSRQPKNTNSQVQDQIRDLQKNKGQCVSIKKIWIITTFLYFSIYLLVVIMLSILSSQNSLLQYDIDLVKIPDQFNRLYCSFATIGQMDLERSLLGKDYGPYLSYRNINHAKSIRNEMESMMTNLKNRFSILENENRLQNLTVRIPTQFNYNELVVTIIQFDMIADIYTEQLYQHIVQSFNYSLINRLSLIDQYYKLQFLKANLINQITSSQNLINEIVVEIQNSQGITLTVLYILLSFKLCFVLVSIFCLIQLWKKPFSIVQLQVKLLSYISEEQIKLCISAAKEAKQLIFHPYRWKRTNYLIECYQKTVVQDQQGILTKVQNNMAAAKKNKQNLQLLDYQFNYLSIYLKNFMYLILLLSFILSSFLYMKYGIDSSQQEISLTIQYVQFKQDLDSLVILSQLIKTNSILTGKVRELGFLDLNSELLDPNKYFHTLETELLDQFKIKSAKAQEVNQYIYQSIINSKKISSSDKSILQALYQDDLCSVMAEDLPFCNFTNNQFYYFPDYPTPRAGDNNREIFRNGINGIFQKLLVILESYYQFELQGLKNTDQNETEYLLSTPEFKHYVQEYFFDIIDIIKIRIYNKAVVKFYATILGSTTDILQNDLKNALFYYLIFGISVLVVQGTLQIQNLSKIQELVQASKFAFILMPLESLNEAKCIAIIKSIIQQYEL